MSKKKSKQKKVNDPDLDFENIDPKNLRLLSKEEVSKFLPSPFEVAQSLKKARITILLDAHTLKVFREEAKKHKVSYQKMIRHVLRKYINNKKEAA